MAVFVRVVEESSFSAAARAFDTTTSAVSKSIARLESRLGARLLTRTTRRVALTDVGSALYANAVRILAEVAEAENTVARIGGGVRGTLRLSVPVMFGEHHVAPLIPRLLAEHTELRVELSLNDRFINLTEESIDAAIRIGELADSSLVAIRIGETESVVCAAPSYLAERGTPRTPHDLSTHDCLRYALVPSAREWRFRERDGRDFSVAVSGRLQVNHGAALTRAAVGAAGIARLPYFMAEEALDSGDLVEVLAEWKTKPSPIHVVHASSSQTPPKVRAFVSLMKGACKSANATGQRRRSGRRLIAKRHENP